MKVLTINSGSSSLKFSVYRMANAEKLERDGEISRIGLDEGSFEVSDGGGRQLERRQTEIADHDAALRMLFDWLKSDSPEEEIAAVGHRLVHGGPDYREPLRLDDGHIRKLEELAPLAPEHLPHEIKAIRSIRNKFSGLPQIACFDTGFHRHLPRIAQMYPLPGEMWRDGIRRYGFHGLSYEYILQELEKERDSRGLPDRIIIAHLGNGASMAAVKNGRSADTTMGFTPAGGLMMGTRSGDLDPGVLVYLQKEKNFGAADINRLINEEAGLKGVSGLSSDMKDLLEKEKTSGAAKQAVALFCYRARKYLGALTAVLGGLDTLIFTAGIGEKSAEIRRRICRHTAYLGIELAEQKNKNNDRIISGKNSKVTVRVMKTDEALMIARHTRRIMQKSPVNNSG